MKQFFIFAGKEFRHIFRDRRTMLILLVMPVVQIVLFGFAITTEVQNVRMAVLDPSDDVLTRRIIEQLDASEYFTLTTRFSSPAQLDDAFRRSQVDMAVVFSSDFANKLYTGQSAVQLVCDATDPNTATMQASYATGIIQTVARQLLPPKVVGRMVSLQPEVKLLYNPQMKSVYNFVPGVMGLILMLICAMMTSVSIVREKEMGTMEVLLVSPVRPIFIILSKAVPYFVLIYKADNGIFYSYLFLKTENSIIRVDARTSDAVALSLRMGAPILIYEDVLEAERMNTEQDAEGRNSEDSELEILQKALQKAVEEENYEQAAELRDKINQLRNQQ